MNSFEQALSSALASGTALVAKLGGTWIYNQSVPPQHKPPAVVFSHVVGADENLTPHRSKRFVYLIKAIAPTLETAGEIDALIEALMRNASLSIPSHSVFWTARLTEVRYIEYDPAGQPAYGHSGADYEFRLCEEG